MKKILNSSDQSQICYTLTGKGETALVFVHGWLGNKSWWNNQRDYFSTNYQIAQMDLAGHGESSKNGNTWSAEQYADEIVTVAKALPAKHIILIGHSMSGAYVTIASLKIPNVKALILVDTLNDLDQLMSLEQASQIFTQYLKDFKSTVENILPQYLFTKTTPAKIKQKLSAEFVAHDGKFAVDALLPLYKTDIREFAKKVTVPVRAINSDVNLTNIANNQKYFADYDCSLIEGVGHYPMLECPEIFNEKLASILKTFNFL